MPESFELGWYYVDRVMNLYVDEYDEALQETKRVLSYVKVEYLCVDEHPDEFMRDDGYNVKHFGRDGELITTLSLTEEDLKDEIGDLEPTDRPMHI